MKQVTPNLIIKKIQSSIGKGPHVLHEPLFYGNELNKQIYSKCLGEELYYKKDVGRITGRNPMTKSPRYNAWIYELNFNQLPDCLFR